MPRQHTVAQGDSVIALSDRFGHFALTIWDDAANAELKERRPNMNALLPGDIVTIPDKRRKDVTKADKARHRFKRKGIPATFRLQVFDVETPRASQEYTLVAEGTQIKGVTDDQGVLECFIDAHVRSGMLTIGPDHYKVALAFGHLDPPEEVSGIQKRLTNLGFDAGPADGVLNDKTKAAIRKFQGRFGLPVTGEADQATVDAITAQHDDPNEFPPPENASTTA